MRQDQRQREGVTTTLMYEVDVGALDARHGLRKAIQPRFSSSPVKMVQPMIDQPLHEGKAGTVFPTIIVERCRPSDALDARAQIIERILRNV